MKTSLLLLLGVLIHVNIFGQNRFEVKNLKFSIDAPENWLEIKNDELLKNIEQYDFSEIQLFELLKSNNSAFNLATYTKYDPKNYKGIIPTIKIRTHKTNAENNVELLKSIENSNNQIKKSLDNFKYIKNPSTISFSKSEIIQFTVQFTLKNNGQEFEIVSYTTYILRNGYFISLNFIEELGKEDNKVFFETLLKSMQI